MISSNYQQLIAQLDRFIRKYYLNQLIRGVLYSVGLILLLFTVFSVLEHYYYFGKGTRKLMFYSFIGVSGLALARWVLMPLLHYFHLGKVISHEQAAQIVGSHFSNVKDKLLNILQLKEQADHSPQADLLVAGIEQKTEEIKLVPFPKAINLGQNRKYLRYALPPLLLLLLILFAAPSMITDSATRLIQNDKEFEREAPFRFSIVNDQTLEAIQYQDFVLDVEVEGEAIPAEAYVNLGGYAYRLKKTDGDRFQYVFKNVQKPVDFHFSANGFNSQSYHLDVLRKPNLAYFDVELRYPAYTGRRMEKVSNVGDFVVPAGTRMLWNLRSENADSLMVRMGNGKPLELLESASKDKHTFEHRALRDAAYKLYISGVDIDGSDSIGYTLSVIPDLHPTISVEQYIDSSNQEIRYYTGEAADDYGLRTLSFNYRITREKGNAEDWQRIPLKKAGGKQISYDYIWNAKELGVKPGDEMVYFFEVYDNDAVNGAKAARTPQMSYNKPTKEQYEELSAQNSEELKDKLEEAREDSKRIQEQIKKLRDELLQKKEMDWQSRKELEKLLEMKKEIDKQLQQAREKMQENQDISEEISETPEDIQEKEEKLEEMMEEAVSDEAQELMEKIEELLQELNKDEALEMLQDMQINEQQQEKNMERLEELYKQLELEKEMMEQIDKLNELAEKQEELAEKTEETKSEEDETNEEQTPKGGDEEKKEGEKSGDKKEGEKSEEQKKLEEEQKEINEEFDKLQEKMDEIEKKNEELENPKEMDDSEEEMEDIEKDLENSMDQLQKQQNKKASKSQKSAAQQMRQKASQMQQQMQSGEMEQMQEDMQTLRQLLENLVGLSFEQEELMEAISGTNPYTPTYVAKVESQFKLIDDFRLVEDSLQSLAKRQMQIETVILEKVTEIKKHMRKAVDQLEERKKTTAATHQQYTMKHVNDLALMLSETMEQMQQQMSSMMQGQQMCNNPNGSGQGKPGQKQSGGPSDKMSKGQQQLGDQMGKSMQKKPGKDGPSSKELAELAAQQAALRKALEAKRREMMMSGEDAKGLQDIIDKMNQNETDLVNKNLSNSTLKRNRDITTRLLEHEKAERERGFDEQREARTAQEQTPELPPALQEYLKKRKAEIAEYRQVSPSLKPYYKFLVEEYYKKLKS